MLVFFLEDHSLNDVALGHYFNLQSSHETLEDFHCIVQFGDTYFIVALIFNGWISFSFHFSQVAKNMSSINFFLS